MRSSGAPSMPSKAEDATAVVFNVQRFSLHDGPGIRTVVFLKGCRLRCLWCDNPESIKPAPELGFARERCSKCGKCGPACSDRAISFDNGGLPLINRKRCTACGKCVEVCFPDALAVYGSNRSATDTFDEVRRDAMFYQGSDGGLTVSGGEPLLQPAFVTALFSLCHKAGISTAFESCGEAETDALVEVLKQTDLALLDLKHPDPGKHFELTGKRNGRILHNARVAVESGVPVQFRMPLIPGLNDGVEDIRSTARLLLELQSKGPSIELMPYHSLGSGKYSTLARDYPLAGIKSHETQDILAATRLFEESGIRCFISK